MRKDYEDALRTESEDGEAEVSLRQVLIVYCNDEAYAIDTLSCREVLRVPNVIPVPRMFPTILGVINLRGNVVSVSDLRVLLGIETCALTHNSRLVVVSNGMVSTAILVDRVGTILDIPEEEIQGGGRAFSGKKMRFLAGQYMPGDILLTRIDIDELFASPEMVVAREKGS